MSRRGPRCTGLWSWCSEARERSTLRRSGQGASCPDVCGERSAFARRLRRLPRKELRKPGEGLECGRSTRQRATNLRPVHYRARAVWRLTNRLRGVCKREKQPQQNAKEGHVLLRKLRVRESL